MSSRSTEPDVRLSRFVHESNGIEGIHRSATATEIEAHRHFLTLGLIDVGAMEQFVDTICGERLREKVGMDVRVGPHLPPPGHPSNRTRLGTLLHAIYDGDFTPFEAHVAYETLHPFMDGNGRSGRALWAWHMRRDGLDPFALPFLHRWYYQSLDGGRNA